MKQFAARFHITPDTRVLDVGGGWLNWTLLEEQPQVTIANVLPPGHLDRQHAAVWVMADGRRLPFEDGAFDVVFSNSVIEHVGDAGDQQQFAAECARVGRRLYVQTPNRQFFFEPHYLTPFVHWLPKETRRRLLGLTGRGVLITLVGSDKASQRKDLHQLVDEVRLLDERELRHLFPGAEVWRERFAGMVKSLIVVRNLDTAAGDG
jgi:ubiquinone/menaquinone biosynthesis C-methylase UbiE